MYDPEVNASDTDDTDVRFVPIMLIVPSNVGEKTF